MANQHDTSPEKTDNDTTILPQIQPHKESHPISYRHMFFYFSTGNFFIWIHGWLFRIHSEVVLPSSPYMQFCFWNSQTDDHQWWGLSSCYPLCFANVSKQDFKLLLWFLYAPLDFEQTTKWLWILCAVATNLGYGKIRVITSHFLHWLSPGGSYPYMMQQIYDFSSSYPYLQQQMQHWWFEFQHPTEEVWEHIHEIQNMANSIMIPMWMMTFMPTWHLWVDPESLP